MGILNRTPDSFYDRGQYWDLDAFYGRAASLVADGADLLDVGGVKAGPGPEVSEAEELDRVVPAIAAFTIASTCPSRSTPGGPRWPPRPSRPGRGRQRHQRLRRPRLPAAAAAAGAAVVATHIRLAPRVPDPDPHYDDVVAEVARFLADRAGRARRPAFPTPGSSSTPGSIWAKRPPNRPPCCALRPSGRARLAAAALGVQQDVPRRPLRSRGRTTGPGATMAAHALGVSLGCRILRAHDVRAARRVCDTLAAVMEA